MLRLGERSALPLEGPGRLLMKKFRLAVAWVAVVCSRQDVSITKHALIVGNGERG